jgi:hypothetical protein
LEIIYIAFIRPILEYGDVIWCICTQYELEQLDKIQNECARIATGATKLISSETLQKEINWESLSERRYKHKLIMFHNMQSNKTPDYISSVIPNPDQSRYSLRNSKDIRGITSRTSTTLYHNSFLPLVIRDWNNLPVTIRNSRTVSSFKTFLNTDRKYTPAYFYTGNRKLQVLHTWLRTNCSALNHHLFLKNISLSPLCNCGQIETTQHFFFECCAYDAVRRTFLLNLQDLSINLYKLLYGDPSLTYKDNVIIFTNVQNYIEKTKRFT